MSHLAGGTARNHAQPPIDHVEWCSPTPGHPEACRIQLDRQGDRQRRRGAARTLMGPAGRPIPHSSRSTVRSLCAWSTRSVLPVRPQSRASWARVRSTSAAEGGCSQHSRIRCTTAPSGRHAVTVTSNPGCCAVLTKGGRIAPLELVGTRVCPPLRGQPSAAGNPNSLKTVVSRKWQMPTMRPSRTSRRCRANGVHSAGPDR